jgi:hypothetical protein
MLQLFFRKLKTEFQSLISIDRQHLNWAEMIGFYALCWWIVGVEALIISIRFIKNYNKNFIEQL